MNLNSILGNAPENVKNALNNVVDQSNNVVIELNKNLNNENTVNNTQI